VPHNTACCSTSLPHHTSPMRHMRHTRYMHRMHHMRPNGHMFQMSHDTLVQCVMTNLSNESRHTGQMSHGTPMPEASASSVCISHVAVCETQRLGQHTNTHTHTHTHAHTHIHTYIYTRHIYMCVYVCVARGACGRWHLSKHTHTHTHTRICIYIYMHIYAYAYTLDISICVHIHIYIYTHT